jgi:hypothetical protein
MSEGGVQRCRNRSSIITAFTASETLQTDVTMDVFRVRAFSKPAEP